MYLHKVDLPLSDDPETKENRPNNRKVREVMLYNSHVVSARRSLPVIGYIIPSLYTTWNSEDGFLETVRPRNIRGRLSSPRSVTLGTPPPLLVLCRPQTL